MIKIGVFRDLERHPVKPSGIGFAQDNAVAVEFVERLKEGTPILEADEIETNPVTVMNNSLVEIEDPQLHVSWAEYTGHSHFSSPCMRQPLRPLVKNSDTIRLKLAMRSI